MVSINASSAASPNTQARALGIKAKATFPALQATGTAGMSSFIDCLGRKGKKNDGFVFAPDGRFIRKHEGKGTVYMNVFENDVRSGLGVKIEDLDGCECTDVKIAPQHVHHVVCK
jgi:hypothetical protein